MKLWIARDKHDYIGLYRQKPIYRESTVTGIADWFDGSFLGYLDSEEFPELTFENSPQEVEVKLVI